MRAAQHFLLAETSGSSQPFAGTASACRFRANTLDTHFAQVANFN
jgi:hypothetical protein